MISLLCIQYDFSSDIDDAVMQYGVNTCTCRLQENVRMRQKTAAVTVTLTWTCQMSCCPSRDTSAPVTCLLRTCSAASVPRSSRLCCQKYWRSVY